jgi:hypothetical protein
MSDIALAVMVAIAQPSTILIVNERTVAVPYVPYVPVT